MDPTSRSATTISYLDAFTGETIEAHDPELVFITVSSAILNYPQTFYARRQSFEALLHPHRDVAQDDRGGHHGYIDALTCEHIDPWDPELILITVAAPTDHYRQVLCTRRSHFVALLPPDTTLGMVLDPASA